MHACVYGLLKSSPPQSVPRKELRLEERNRGGHFRTSRALNGDDPAADVKGDYKRITRQQTRAQTTHCISNQFRNRKGKSFQFPSCASPHRKSQLLPPPTTNRTAESKVKLTVLRNPQRLLGVNVPHLDSLAFRKTVRQRMLSTSSLDLEVARELSKPSRNFGRDVCVWAGRLG